MKVLGLISTILLLLVTPVGAVEYRGTNLDGRQLTARVYSGRTGGVYDAQVQFQGDRATIVFGGGGEMMIRLNQSIIIDPANIAGFGAPGQVYVGRVFSIGLNHDYAMENIAPSGLRRSNDLWVISLDPAELDQIVPPNPELREPMPQTTP